MREDTFRRKKASRLFKDIGGRGWLAGRMAEILCQGKRRLDGLSLELGGMVAEAIMYMEREEMAGPDYHPYCSQIQKWASQRGSIFVGDRKLGVEHPRLRGPDGEVVLRTYGKLKERNGFSEELLGKVLRGLSGRRYRDTLVEAGQAFGVSATSVSRHIVEATAKRLKRLRKNSPFTLRPAQGERGS